MRYLLAGLIGFFIGEGVAFFMTLKREIKGDDSDTGNQRSDIGD